MNDDIEHGDEAWERALKRALSQLPQEPAPRSLQRKLRAIPRRENFWGWLHDWRPAWVFALLALPLVLVIAVQLQRLEQKEQALAHQAVQVAQARQELVLALSYLEKANEIANRQIAQALESGLARPVTDNTVYGLQKPLEITRELQL